MKTPVIPSGARDLAIAMSASSNHARIDEAKGLQHLESVRCICEVPRRLRDSG